MEELGDTGYQSRVASNWTQREEVGGGNSGLEMQLHLVRIANAFYTGCQHPNPSSLTLLELHRHQIPTSQWSSNVVVY